YPLRSTNDSARAAIRISRTNYSQPCDISLGDIWKRSPEQMEGRHNALRLNAVQSGISMTAIERESRDMNADGKPRLLDQVRDERNAACCFQDDSATPEAPWSQNGMTSG